MPIFIDEIPESREVGFDPPTVRTKWVIEGVFSSDTVASLALSSIPDFAAHPAGTLYLQPMQIQELGHELYHITAHYGQDKRIAGTYSIEVSDTTVQLQAKAGRHVATYPSGYPSHNGLINVKGSVVEGFDGNLPATKISIHFKHPQGVITESRIRALSKLKNCIDSAGFLGWDGYESYFLGFEGRAGSDCETEISYHIAVRENITDMTVGGIEEIDVKGWDIWWASYRPTIVSGRPSQTALYVNVVRIPQEKNFASILGFG